MSAPRTKDRPLRQVADEQQVTVDTALARLRSAGIEADPDEPLRDVAKRNGRHAPELATILLTGTNGR